MFQQLKQSRVLFWTVELLAVALLILIVTQLSFILEPIGKFVGAVFVPLIISGFLYYLLNPVVEFLTKIPVGKKHVPRGVAIALVMVLLIGLIVLGALSLFPALVTQIAKIIDNTPALVDALQRWVDQMSKAKWVNDLNAQISVDQLRNQIEKYGKSVIVGTATSLSSIIGTLTTITITAITVPVMTIYMLNDGHKLVPFLQKVFPDSRRKNVADIFGRLNDTISKYISGQAIEMIFVGVFTSIGYWIIGQNYALLLGVIAGLTNLIPYVGPYIGLVPALFVGFIQSPLQAVWVIVVVLIVQQIDSNLIYPRIMGTSLNIHPLTIIVILLAAGNIAGVVGMILAIPFYAIVRTVVVYAWQLWQLEKAPREDI